MMTSQSWSFDDRRRDEFSASALSSVGAQSTRGLLGLRRSGQSKRSSIKLRGRSRCLQAGHRTRPSHQDSRRARTGRPVRSTSCCHSTVHHEERCKGQSRWIRIRDPNHKGRCRCWPQSGHRRHPRRSRSMRGRHRRRHRSNLHRCMMGCRSGSNSRPLPGRHTLPRGRHLRGRCSQGWSTPCPHRRDPIRRHNSRSPDRTPHRSRIRHHILACRWASNRIQHTDHRNPNPRHSRSGNLLWPRRCRTRPRSFRNRRGPHWPRSKHLRNISCRYNRVRSSLRSIRLPRSRRIPALRIRQARRSRKRCPRPWCNRQGRHHRSTRSSRRHCSRETGEERSKARRSRFRSPFDNAGARWRHRRNPTDLYNSLDQWRRPQNNRRRRRRRGSRCFRGRSRC